jgi:aconitate hydratase
VAAALTGQITDPRELPALLGIRHPKVQIPADLPLDDGLIIPPAEPHQAAQVQVLRGPTIVVPDRPSPLPEDLEGQVLIKLGDKVSTDQIMPAGPFLKLRSNVPEYAKVVFNSFNQPGRPTFAQRALDLKSKGLAGVIVAGDGYGQGSSREHAALCPMYLGVRIVLARGIERIHRSNLINFCIVPIILADPDDYQQIQEDDLIVIKGLRKSIAEQQQVSIQQKDGRWQVIGQLMLSERERQILLAGGLMGYVSAK